MNDEPSQEPAPNRKRYWFASYHLNVNGLSQFGDAIMVTDVGGGVLNELRRAIMDTHKAEGVVFLSIKELSEEEFELLK